MQLDGICLLQSSVQDDTSRTVIVVHTHAHLVVDMQQCTCVSHLAAALGSLVFCSVHGLTSAHIQHIYSPYTCPTKYFIKVSCIILKHIREWSFMFGEGHLHLASAIFMLNLFVCSHCCLLLAPLILCLAEIHLQSYSTSCFTRKCLGPCHTVRVVRSGCLF